MPRRLLPRLVQGSASRGLAHGAGNLGAAAAILRPRPTPWPVSFLVRRASPLGPVVRLGRGALSARWLVTTAGPPPPRPPAIPLDRLAPVPTPPSRRTSPHVSPFWSPPWPLASANRARPPSP